MEDKYYVCGHSGIPFGGQPNDGYSLQEAVDRIKREIVELKRLGFSKVSNKDFYIICKDNFKEVQYEI